MSTRPTDNEQHSHDIDPRKADSLYTPFPPFSVWSRLQVDDNRWNEYLALIEDQRKTVTGDQLRYALEVVSRAAAVDTGALEGLYDTDSGFTISVARQSFMWEAAAEQKGEKFKALFESQLEGYHLVLDLATQAVPIAEANIRFLHEVICKGQTTYRARTEVGWQDLPFRKGEYKSLPNHVLTREGRIHSYAPVDMTSDEMHRFCQELRSKEFLNAHPILQSSYAHYAFVSIHPFADGNGRVARALASVYTYRAASIPLMILAEQKEAYRDSLRKADQGEFQYFIDFVLERALESLLFAETSLDIASERPVDESLASLRSLYVTKGGYTQTEVDTAGITFMEQFYTALDKKIKAVSAGNPFLQSQLRKMNEGYNLSSPAYRTPLPNDDRAIELCFNSAPPATARVCRKLTLEIPKDCDGGDDLVIYNAVDKSAYKARLNEVIPDLKGTLLMRIALYVEKLVANLLDELRRAAEQSKTTE